MPESAGGDGKPWMAANHDNNTTLQSWDTLNLSTLKKAGSDELHGPCPVTGNGKDCFWIQPDRKAVGCRSCSTDGGELDGPQFKEHLAALGMTFGASDVIRPVRLDRPRP